MTTPDCLDVHAMLADMRAADVDMAFMEVSSHALDQNRVAGVGFGGAVFSNLTQDHLDYHHDMETYFKAKAKLFLDEDGRPFADRVMAGSRRHRLWPDGPRIFQALPCGQGAFQYDRRAAFACQF